MNDLSIERLFADYVAKGDISALGEVFDRIAPDLERLATGFALLFIHSREIAQVRSHVLQRASRSVGHPAPVHGRHDERNYRAHDK